LGDSVFSAIFFAFPKKFFKKGGVRPNGRANKTPAPRKTPGGWGFMEIVKSGRRAAYPTKDIGGRRHSGTRANPNNPSYSDRL
jgi:hypothetical protein